MINKIKLLLNRSPLVRGSFIVLAGSVITNFGAYLFHLLMGRLLGPANYGILESLISFMYFLGIPVGVLSLVVVKYVSQEKKDIKKIGFLISWLLKKSAIYGLIFLIAFLAFFPVLKNLIKVDSFLLFLGLGIAGFISIFQSIYSSTLQGMMKFVELSITNIFSSWIKLIIAVIFVILGFKIGGAVYSISIAALATLFLTYKIIKKFVPLTGQNNNKLTNNFSNMGNYSLAILIQNFSFICFFTIDIILARFFLTPTLAGQYASLSVLGKIIFFASSPILSVMFPMVSEKYSNGEKYQKTFFLSLFFVLLISVFISFVYFIFPKTMIGILFGNAYLGGSSDLWLFSVFISIYSVCALLMNFFLSISKTKIIYVSLFFVALQIVLISFFHQNISQIVLMNIITLSLFLICLLVYCFSNIFKPNKIYE